MDARTDVLLQTMRNRPVPTLSVRFDPELQRAVRRRRAAPPQRRIATAVLLALVAIAALVATTIDGPRLTGTALAALAGVLLFTLLPVSYVWSVIRHPWSAVLLLSLALPAVAADQPRILLTNDNGIEDRRMRLLASALAEVADVVVVASTADHSGGSNYMPAVRDRRFRATRTEIASGIEAWAVEGFPADCVVFALTGPMRDQPPDLVVSGINGGANAADDWFGSGTIGAARTGAYFGIPSIAVSGGGSPDAPAFAQAVDWVVAFVQSAIVRGLRAPEYLTVSLPLEWTEQVRGIAVVPRARGVLSGSSEPVAGGEWRLRVAVRTPPGRTDLVALREGKIAIVAMRADESDVALENRLHRLRAAMPAWPAPR